MKRFLSVFSVWLALMFVALGAVDYEEIKRSDSMKRSKQKINRNFEKTDTFLDATIVSNQGLTAILTTSDDAGGLNITNLGILYVDTIVTTGNVLQVGDTLLSNGTFQAIFDDTAASNLMESVYINGGGDTLASGFFGDDDSGLGMRLGLQDSGGTVDTYITLRDDDLILLSKDTYVDGDLLPQLPSAYELGSLGNPWLTLFLDDDSNSITFANGAVLGVDASSNLLVNGEAVVTGSATSFVQRAGDTMTGDLNMDGFELTNVNTIIGQTVSNGNPQNLNIFGGSPTHVGPGGNVIIQGGNSKGFNNLNGGLVVIRPGVPGIGSPLPGFKADISLQDYLTNNLIYLGWENDSYITNMANIWFTNGVSALRNQAGVTLPAMDGSALTNLPVAGGSVPLTGATMTGPLTNELGFFGDGSGLTNLPAGGGEIDPVFTNWLATNTFVQTEQDPVWTNERDTGFTVGGDIVPDASNTISLGSATLPWADVFVSTGSVYLGGVKLSANTNGELVVSSSISTDSVLTAAAETDPVHTNWLATNTYVQTEVDPGLAAGETLPAMDGSALTNLPGGVDTHGDPSTNFLNTLSDVGSVAAPTGGDHLEWNGAAWSNVAPSYIADTDTHGDVSTNDVSALANVDAPAPANGEVLAWNSASGVWTNAAGGGGGGGGGSPFTTNAVGRLTPNSITDGLEIGGTDKSAVISIKGGTNWQQNAGLATIDLQSEILINPTNLWVASAAYDDYIPRIIARVDRWDESAANRINWHFLDMVEFDGAKSNAPMFSWSGSGLAGNSQRHQGFSFGGGWRQANAGGWSGNADAIAAWESINFNVWDGVSAAGFQIEHIGSDASPAFTDLGTGSGFLFGNYHESTVGSRYLIGNHDNKSIDFWWESDSAGRYMFKAMPAEDQVQFLFDGGAGDGVIISNAPLRVASQGIIFSDNTTQTTASVGGGGGGTPTNTLTLVSTATNGAEALFPQIELFEATNSTETAGEELHPAIVVRQDSGSGVIGTVFQDFDGEANGVFSTPSQAGNNQVSTFSIAGSHYLPSRGGAFGTVKEYENSSAYDIMMNWYNLSSQAEIQFAYIPNTATETAGVAGEGILRMRPKETTGGAVNQYFWINESNQDMDFRFTGTSNDDILMVDAGNERVGVGGSRAPAEVFHVTNGNMRVDGIAKFNATYTNQTQTASPQVRIADGGIRYESGDQAVSPTLLISEPINFNDPDGASLPVAVRSIGPNSSNAYQMIVSVASSDSDASGTVNAVAISPRHAMIDRTGREYKLVGSGSTYGVGMMWYQTASLASWELNYIDVSATETVDYDAPALVRITAEHGSIQEGMYVNQDQMDFDFIWHGDTETDLIHGDASTERVGIGGTAEPAEKLHVTNGNMRVDGDIILESGGDIVFDDNTTQTTAAVLSRLLFTAAAAAPLEESSIPAVSIQTNANGSILTLAMDDTTAEYVGPIAWSVPAGIDTAQDYQFTMHGWSTGGTVSIGFRMREDLNGWVNGETNVFTAGTAATAQGTHQFTVSITNDANSFMAFEVWRDGAGTLVGDWYMTGIRAEMYE